MNEIGDAFSQNEDLIPLSGREFTYITALVYDRFGIHLPEQKKVLVSGRLSKRLRRLGCKNFSDYVRLLENDPTGAEISEMINLLTTNHSFFFREGEHFDFLANKVLPDLSGEFARGGPYPLRIWSAGCASGEEVYSVAMLLHDRFAGKPGAPDIGLLATDISLHALRTAREGIYAAQKFNDMPSRFRQRYLSATEEREYAVADEIKAMVLFKRLNLMAESYPMKGQFDVVFCRNVMIYFNQESRNRVVSTLYRYVKPGGYLFIGHSESLPREWNPFDYVKPAIYRKGVQPTKSQGVRR